MTYSRRTPLEGLSLLQRLLWPLIFAQLMALKALMRARYGCGVPYWITISRFGRVALRHMPPDFAASDGAPVAYQPIRHDFSADLVRGVFRLACAADITPAPPCPESVIRILQKSTGQAAVCPDTS